MTAGTSAVCLAALPTASTAATVSAVAECAGTCSACRRRPNDAGASAHADDEHLQVKVKHRVPGAAGGDEVDRDLGARPDPTSQVTIYGWSTSGPGLDG